MSASTRPNHYAKLPCELPEPICVTNSGTPVYRWRDFPPHVRGVEQDDPNAPHTSDAIRCCAGSTRQWNREKVWRCRETVTPGWYVCHKHGGPTRQQATS